MSQRTIYFSVNPGESGGHWIAVNDQDVSLNNHKGTTTVDGVRQKHVLTWWFTGEEGTKISIVGSLDAEGAQIVVKVESEVPKDEYDGGGRRRFDLSIKGKK
ncbi:hypothetical protein GCM10011487_54490 [Steroidobacter agaridevorans]|uniref:Uncharacterized protein n=1 Tax=Steroidobacter agaridevorans TaxID=2695856 RepID=A0A829YJR5_9GAMM|nr:hypothetical protein [Steroidobacter agaridevorans]GFE83449.1 hypothetical protein GCM10011487_54490 [Steroidobacter agaridevorans]GFE86669.1 hypothetical protein GCM10011488_16230 [Steroidobacter agaridevorans]